MCTYGSKIHKVVESNTHEIKLNENIYELHKTQRSQMKVLNFADTQKSPQPSKHILTNKIIIIINWTIFFFV